MKFYIIGNKDVFLSRSGQITQEISEVRVIQDKAYAEHVANLYSSIQPFIVHNHKLQAIECTYDK